jgi:hypothetical protein
MSGNLIIAIGYLVDKLKPSVEGGTIITRGFLPGFTKNRFAENKCYMEKNSLSIDTFSYPYSKIHITEQYHNPGQPDGN